MLLHFRISFQLDEIFCITIPRKMEASAAAPSKMRNTSDIAGDIGFRVGITGGYPVEKAVESVHNFLYILREKGRGASHQGGNIQLFLSGAIFWYSQMMEQGFKKFPGLTSRNSMVQ